GPGSASMISRSAHWGLRATWRSRWRRCGDPDPALTDRPCKGPGVGPAGPARAARRWPAPAATAASACACSPGVADGTGDCLSPGGCLVGLVVQPGAGQCLRCVSQRLLVLPGAGDRAGCSLGPGGCLPGLVV